MFLVCIILLLRNMRRCACHSHMLKLQRLLDLLLVRALFKVVPWGTNLNFCPRTEGYVIYQQLMDDRRKMRAFLQSPPKLTSLIVNAQCDVSDAARRYTTAGFLQRKSLSVRSLIIRTRGNLRVLTPKLQRVRELESLLDHDRLRRRHGGPPWPNDHVPHGR